MNCDQAIPDDKLQKLLNVLYNLYFNKWKRRMPAASDEERRQCIEELDSICRQGEQYPIVEALALAFYMELDARSRGGVYALTVKDIDIERGEGFL
ncbi:MAG: hypothetical protein IKF39_02170 [Oscillospiraceae bacterium]|nr:hypothetical protein [Oscillospiraceae bacterium]